MPCESCAVQFSVFKRKRACCECERFYCSGCLRRGGGSMCAACRVLSTRPLYRNNIAHLKVRDLQCFLNRQNVSTRGCVEKDELVSLCVSHVNGATYRRGGTRNSGAFSSLKGFTNNINDFLNSAFEMRNAPPHPSPPPASRQPTNAPPQPQTQPCQTRNCFNLSHSHTPTPTFGATPGNPTPVSQYNPRSERFTTRPGGEADIEVPLPESVGGGSAVRTSVAESALVDTADCFEIEDIDDSGWEFVTRPADPLPNDSDILITTTDGTVQRIELLEGDPPDLIQPLVSTQPPVSSQPPTSTQPIGARQSDDHGRISSSTNNSTMPLDLTLGPQSTDVSFTEHSSQVPVPLEQSPSMLELGRARAATMLGRARALCDWERERNEALQRERSEALQRERSEALQRELQRGRERELAASTLDLRTAASSPSDTASLNDELLDHTNHSNDESPRHVTLAEMKSSAELETLSVKQLKELLTRNRVEFRGCIERRDLLDRAKMLWREHAQYKDEVENIPMEECCKICMAAPLECVLLECGHIAACTTCSKQLAECPICRQYVVRAVRFFRS